MKLNNSGQILLEALVAITVAAMVMTLGSQLVYLSLIGNKVSGDNNVASGLVEETFEALRAVGTENWLNIYSLTHGSTNYYPIKSAGKWVLTAGAENISLNLTVYSRSFIIQNVCREAIDIGNDGRDITGTTDNNGSATTCNNISNSRHDPSTQKITVTVSWAGNALISDSEYFSRWRNKVCAQTAWNSSGSGDNSCSTSVYDSISHLTTGATLEIK